MFDYNQVTNLRPAIPWVRHPLNLYDTQEHQPLHSGQGGQPFGGETPCPANGRRGWSPVTAKKGIVRLETNSKVRDK